MKCHINTMCIGSTNALDGLQLFFGGGSHPCKSSESCQECLGFGISNAFDFGQRGMGHGLSFGGIHARYRIAVNLFLNAVNQHKHLILFGDANLARICTQGSCLVKIVLDHAEYGNVNPHITHEFSHHRHMTFTTVQ